MYSRWFNLTVFLLWLTMMSWLVTQKVLPALLVGEPPSYEEILDAQEEHPTVGWAMRWNNRPLGWAISTTTPILNDLTEINSRIHFDELPIDEMAPDWLRGVLRPLDRAGVKLQMDAVSTLVFDPLGRLSRFQSAIQFDRNVDALKVNGIIDNGNLSLSVKAGDFTYDKQVPLPNSTMLGDALSPQSHLPGLREGQAWTVEVYSPLLPPNAPMDILQAKVEGQETIQWEGEFIKVWLVVYRKDTGSRGTHADQHQGRLWVHPNGTVLKQELRLFNATLTLVRLSDDAAAELVEKVGKAERRGYDGLRRGTKVHPPIRHKRRKGAHPR